MTSLLGSLILLAVGHSAPATDTDRTRELLDSGWRFHLGNSADRNKDFGFGGPHEFAKAGDASGPARSSFNDSGWRSLNLPHDWVVEQPIENSDDGNVGAHGYRPTGRAYPDKSIGWYRRRFDVPVSDMGKRISVEFDGIYRDSTVWLNGHVVGRNVSGYMGFRCDLTDFINYGRTNTLVVRADASEGEGWFYEGGGIYRHVWLVKTNPLHVPQWGLAIGADVENGRGSVTIQTEVMNESDTSRSASVVTQVLDPDGKDLGQATAKGVSVAPWSMQVVKQTLQVASPNPWSPDSPTLYKAVSHVLDGEKSIDDASSTFGFRTIHFDADHGLFLNGKHVFIQGTCNHQDHAGVGSALPDAVQYFRIKQLKEMGSNAYRTSHNPPTPELLDACDKLGMMVMDENRLLDSAPEGMSQLERLVRRDRNHPSVILWSIGNEEFAVQSSDRGQRIAESLIRKVHSLDTSRPISYAGNNDSDFRGVNALVDVRGVNYIHGTAPDTYHKAHPLQPVMGSEEGSTVSTRGEYANDPQKGYVRAYDTEVPSWANSAEGWMQYSRSRPWYAGAFVWTGFDYRGEPTPYGWPCINSHFGILDTCGFPKDNFYFYKAWWGTEDVVHLLPNWNWDKAGQMVDVWCYSNTDEVELVLNGTSIGRKPMPKYGHVSWQVPYTPGTLEARGYRGGKLVKTDKVETAGPAAKILLSSDRPQISADGADVSVVKVSVVDAQGRVVPGADQEIQLAVDNGSMVGVGNGDPSSHEEDRFFSEPKLLTPENWVMMSVPNGTTTVDKLDWSSASPVQITGQTNQLPNPDTSAAFKATFEATAEVIASNSPLQIGQIDDFGWVYLNGKKIGETTEWDRAYSFDVKSALKPGTNSLEIVVKNNGGQGGLGIIGMSLLPSVVPAHRKVFHGLAEAIIGQTATAGKVVLHASAPGLEGATLEVAAVAKG